MNTFKFNTREEAVSYIQSFGITDDGFQYASMDIPRHERHFHFSWDAVITHLHDTWDVDFCLVEGEKRETMIIKLFDSFDEMKAHHENATTSISGIVNLAWAIRQSLNGN